MRFIASLTVALCGTALVLPAAAQPAKPAGASESAPKPNAKKPDGVERPGRMAHGAAKANAGPVDRKARLEERAQKMEERAKQLRAQGKEDIAKKFDEKAAALRDSANNPDRARKVSAEQRSKTRAQRKLSRIKRLHRKYGPQLERPEVQAELTTHSVRNARLRRMKTLAREQNNDEMTQRVNALIMKEHRRHSRKIAELTGVGAPRKGGMGEAAGAVRGAPGKPEAAAPAGGASKMEESK